MYYQPWLFRLARRRETKRQKRKMMDLASSSFNLSNLYHIFFYFTLGCLFLLWILSYTYPYRFTPSLVRLVFWWSLHLLNVYYIN